MSGEQLASLMMGGALAGFFLASITFFVLFLAAVYVYTSYAWMTLGKKLRYDRPWLAWIPFASTSMVLEMGGFHWALVFLFLIPILGWIALGVLHIISTWRIFEKRKYPGWYSLSMIIPQIGGILYLIALGFVAFKAKKK